MKTLSVVILNWNSIDLLTKCLASLEVDHRSLEVIVVDNGSSEQDRVSRVAVEWGVDHFVALPSNEGVARGRNIGLRRATCATLCVLDVDTEVVAGALLKLALVARDPRVGVVGPRLVDGDGNLQLTCRRLPTLITQLLRRFPTLDRFGILRDYELHDMSHDHRLSVGYVIGACQVFRREVYEECGPYFEASRFGYEDTDLCLQALKRGLRVVYEPSAEVAHLERRMARSWSSRLTYEHVAALVKFFRRHKYWLRKPSFDAHLFLDDPDFGSSLL